MRLGKGLRQHFRIASGGTFVAKHGYTEDEARHVAQLQGKNAYRCPMCRDWHVGGTA